MNRTEYVRAVVQSAPPLSSHQVTTLQAALLAPAGDMEKAPGLDTPGPSTRPSKSTPANASAGGNGKLTSPADIQHSTLRLVS